MNVALLRARPRILNRVWRFNHYKTLGIDVAADKKEIKKAYLGLAKKFHPDANPDDSSASENFQKIQAAYEILSDKDQKAEYDRIHVKRPVSRSTNERPYHDSNRQNEFDSQWAEFDDIYFNGRSSNERRKGASGPFDPWDHAFRNNQAKRMWEMAMEMEHGKNWSEFWDDDFKDDYYDDDDEAFFEDFQRKQFENFFRETNFRNPYSEDFYNEFYNINDNHQRYHYKNFDSWQNDRSAYENKFNQKYGHAKHYSRKKKEKSEKKKKKQRNRDKMNFDMGRESGEKYWETSWDSHRSDQPHYSDNDYYADQRNSYDAYENYYTDRNNMEGWNEFVDNWEKSSQYEKSKKQSTKAKNYQTDQSSSTSKTKAKNQFKGPDSVRNAKKVHAQLNEFGEATIQLDGHEYVLEVQKDGSIVMGRKKGNRKK